MKRIALLLLLFAARAFCQSPVTVSGTVADAGGNPAATGTVQFDIQPQSSSLHYYVPNVTAITPQTVICNVVAGALQSQTGGPCQVWGNDVISPSNTTYTVTFFPNGQQTNQVPQECITGTAYSLNAPVFCPVVSVIPQYNTITGSPISANVVPAANNVFTIGNAQAYYAAGYINNLFVNHCFGPGCGGGGGAPFPPSFSVQLANSTSSAFLSDPNITINTTTHNFTAYADQGTINGSLFSEPADAVTAACATPTIFHSVFWPVGTYNQTRQIGWCSNLIMNGAASSWSSAGGTTFHQVPGSAIWGAANPNANATSGSQGVQSVSMNNILFDISANPQSLGAYDIKGVRAWRFFGANVLMNGDVNVHPGFTADGSNYTINNGNYDGEWDGNVYDLSTYSTGTCAYVTASDPNFPSQPKGGSNSNKYYGSMSRCGTAILSDGGNGNLFDLDFEGWNIRGFDCEVSGTQNCGGNRIFGRAESNAYNAILSWQPSTVVNVSYLSAIIDSQGFVEIPQSAGTTGTVEPNFAGTSINGITAESGGSTVTWKKQYAGVGVYLAAGTSGNVVSVLNSGFYDYGEDVSGFNNFAPDATVGPAQVYQAATSLSDPERRTRSYWNISANTGFPDNAPVNSIGGIFVHGENWADRYFGLCNISSCASGHSLIRSDNNSQNQFIHIPNTGDGDFNLLLSGEDVVVAPQNTYTGGGNFGSLALRIQGSYPGVGVLKGSYVSGGTCTGTGTANLSSFNNGSTATATVPVVSGVITVGPLFMTNNGVGATAPPTTATLSNGTGTVCSGTATITTQLTAATDQYIFTDNLGTGPNPTSDLIILHSGSAGVATADLEDFNLRLFNANPATASANSPAGWLEFFGAWWDTVNSISHQDSFRLSPTFTCSGAACTNTALLSHNGITTLNFDFTVAQGFFLPSNTTVGTQPVPTTSSSTPPTAGNAACIKSAGPPVLIGYCSTSPGGSGTCTCN